MSQSNSRNRMPFFIVGCERSGTTLLQTLLDAHKNITIPPESHIFERYTNLFHYYGNLKKEKNLRLFVRHILSDFWIKRWKLDISVKEFCNSIKDKSIKGCLLYLFSLIIQKDQSHRWGEKTPRHIDFLNDIRNIVPQALYIHIIRDGRDVAVSLGQKWFGPNTIYELGQKWEHVCKNWENFKKEISPEHCLEVQYEKLVSNPQIELDRIFKFLGEKSYILKEGVPETSRRKYYTSLEKHHEALNRPISTIRTGIYKTKLKKKEIEIFESLAGEMLERYGYTLESKANYSVKVNERFLSFIKNQSLRFLRKIFNPFFIRSESQIRWRIFRMRTRKILIKNLY